MKAFLLSGLVGLSSLGALPFAYKYEMATCPTASTISTNGSCIAAQVCSAGSCTGTAPTGSTEGMSLSGVDTYRVTICAALGQTLSGAGSMQSYTYNTAEGAWARGSSDAQVTNSGVRCQSFDFNVGLRFDRMRYVASGVTVSGGSTLDVLMEGGPKLR